MGAGGSAPIPPPTDQPVVVNECPTAPDPALKAGGAANGGVLLYPYDGTIFPAGLLPPTMQWSSSGADAVYLHMKSSLFEYTGCFGPIASVPPNSQQFQLPIPATAWNAATQQTGGASDPITVELNVKSGGTVIGLKRTLVIARGKLKGDLFYNTYTSPQANNNGAVMKLRLGAAAPQVLLTDTGLPLTGPCWSCHSLSANGNMLVAQHHNYTPGLASYNSASFDLKANPALSPPPKTQMPSATAEMGLGPSTRMARRC